MNQKLRLALLAPLLAAVVFLAGRLASADPPGGKNLKVLPTTMSKVEIKKVMKGIADGLGVKCDHCHNQDDFAQDTPNKETARGMLKMVNTINTTYFKGQQKVTCVTCHRGKQKPETP